MTRLKPQSARLEIIQSLAPHFRRKQSFQALSTVSPNLESKGFNEYLTPEHAIYLSTSTDPLFNLTLEDWYVSLKLLVLLGFLEVHLRFARTLFGIFATSRLFRNASASSPLLLIYRDSPCVVIGRNQNPWTEVNFPALRTVGTTFVRRRSGGGTVYHVCASPDLPCYLSSFGLFTPQDLGNTNFSIHLPQSSFDRRATGNVILGAVRSLGIDAQLNDRNDICIGPYKISNSSRFILILKPLCQPTRTGSALDPPIYHIVSH